MQNRNPYAAPHANVARGDDAEEYGEIKIFSAAGRLGRLRYIGYTFGLTILIFILIAIASGLAALADPAAAVTVAGIGYVALIVVQVLLTIQRSHDMNVTGWLSLISLVPLAFLVFWFVPGTPGENNYGKPPPPNTGGVIALACLLPFAMIFGVGILAAIAIPAYQDYTIRAQISEGLNLAAGPKAAVAEAYLRGGVAPSDRSAAGLPADAADTSGKYVSSIDVVGGTLVVTYGAEANSMIAGRVLGMQPYVSSDRGVVWRCGEGAAPQGAAAMDPRAPSAAGVTDVEARYLPSACRP
jgi:type IV pilus assembly protein PilA